MITCASSAAGRLHLPPASRRIRASDERNRAGGLALVGRADTGPWRRGERGVLVEAGTSTASTRLCVEAEIERQTHVVLGDGAGGVLGVKQVVELRVLEPRADGT